jgi:hypothetical protein
VALLFETDAAPYVVVSREKASELEVPYRRGNGTYSARRQDLIRILSPLQRVPEIELMDGQLTCQTEGGTRTKFKLELDVYIVPRSDRVIYFPAHRTSVTLGTHGAVPVELGVALYDYQTHGASRKQMPVPFPHMFTLRASGQAEFLTPREIITARGAFLPTEGDAVVPFVAIFTPVEGKDFLWRLCKEKGEKAGGESSP